MLPFNVRPTVNRPSSNRLSRNLLDPDAEDAIKTRLSAADGDNILPRRVVVSSDTCKI